MTRVIKTHTDIIGVIALAALVVTLYSFVGAYMLSASDAPIQVAASERSR
ncbi:MAG: hypothetical protein KBD50_01170 [Candidatus Pacebacteria bacterium]|nr:hypothetical protein [Candidatus Paceibacterota bacterium]